MTSAIVQSLKDVQLIVAQTRERGIGFQGGLPWPRLPLDMKRFVDLSSITSQPDLQNAVIMGRKTWDSIPPAFRPLKNRVNIIITRQEQLYVYF